MEYLLTLRIKFKAMDDYMAREKVKEEFSHLITPEVEPKLQEIRSDGPPRKINGV